jgi:hypothetical protein
MSQLQEIYIKKYISSKDYNIVLKTALVNFEYMYDESKSIINKDLDLIIFLMSKGEFLGLIRYTIIMHNLDNMTNKIVLDEKNKFLSKKEVIDEFIKIEPFFIIYLAASLYAYI